MERFTIMMTAALFGAIAASHHAHSQEWPSKPVRIVVPYAAGGTSDVLARLMGQAERSPAFYQRLAEQCAALSQDRAAPAAFTVDQIRARVRAGPVVHVDETGWRQNGKNGYLWTAGMNADDALPFDPALLRSGAVVADFVTKGDITPLLARARSLGLAFVTGAQIAASQVDLQTSWFQMERFSRAPREM